MRRFISPFAVSALFVLLAGSAPVVPVLAQKPVSPKVYTKADFDRDPLLKGQLETMALRKKIASRFNETQRRRIFQETARAEARAYKRGMSYDEEMRSIDKCRVPIAKRWGLTPKQLECVAGEGVEKDWKQ